VRVKIVVLDVLQLLTLVAGLWPGFREIAFPHGTTEFEALLVLLLLIIWADIIRIRARLGD
jgi:hypothetical protein